jgi:hypothetical protein
MRLPDAYLDLTLREVIALHAHAAPRGKGVELDLVHAAVDTYAQRLERARLVADADQREWLGEQIDSITIAPPAPTVGGRDA